MGKKPSKTRFIDDDSELIALITELAKRRDGVVAVGEAVDDDADTVADRLGGGGDFQELQGANLRLCALQAAMGAPHDQERLSLGGSGRVGGYR